MFQAAVEHITESAGWPVRIDARIMDSIPTRFDVERDVFVAPTPTLISLPSEERQRLSVLARLRIPQQHMDEFIACTPHIGGIPVHRPHATAEARAAADSARQACATHATYAIAILGLPRRAADGAPWKIRVYFLTAVSRQVYDLVVRPGQRAFTVIGREDVLSVSS